MPQCLPKICGDSFQLHMLTWDRQGHRKKMLWDISTWQVLTEDFCALQSGEGKKKREKLCRYFCKDKSLEKLNTQNNQSWGHMRLLESSWPQRNVSILKSTYNNSQHPWQSFPIPFLFPFPKQQSGNGCINKGEGKLSPPRSFIKGSSPNLPWTDQHPSHSNSGIKNSTGFLSAGRVFPLSRGRSCYFGSLGRRLWFTAKVSRGHDTAIHQRDISPREDKQNIGREGVEKLFVLYFSHSLQINHPKLSPCIFPTGSSTCCYLMCTEFSSASWLEKLNFPSLGLDLLATSDYETLGILKTSDAALNEAEPGGLFHKNLPNLFMLEQRDSEGSQW